MIKYLRKLILSDSKESSKRFIALYSMILVTFIVVVFTNSTNNVIVLTTLCGFVLTLVGVSAWQAVKTKNNDKTDY
jgi:uncharacterized membrane protein HdeD (DUF308 family)